MAEAILGDKESKSLDNGKSWQIKDVEYSLPNKHYIPIDLSWTKEKIDNLDEKNAEVFLPSAHPSWVRELEGLEESVLILRSRISLTDLFSFPYHIQGFDQSQNVKTFSS